MSPLIKLKTTPPLLIALALVFFALSPPLKAQCPTACAGGNTALGLGALDSVTTGINNTAVGSNALRDDTTGAYNVAVGGLALANNTTGQQNMAVGAEALLNSNGNFNLAIGFRVLFMNTTGSRLTGIGAAALRNNTTASDNTAIGSQALRENTTGENNTAIGSNALAQNTTASGNTAIGDIALANNDSSGAGLGNSNTAVGAGALFSDIDGNSNNAVGFNALGSNDDGLFNNVMGFGAMADNVSGSGNVAIGDSAGAGVEGDFNIYLGAFAGPSAPGPESETIRIGDVFNTACFIGGIRDQTATGGAAVFVDANGKLGTVTSSARFKDDIKPMDKASEVVLALKPVTFRYKKGIDPQGIPQFGLLAEEVEKMNPDPVVRDKEGKPYSVRYDHVNAMLLNEFLKEHRKVQEMAIAVFSTQLKEQAAQIQKVNAQLEASKPVPQVVNNP